MLVLVQHIQALLFLKVYIFPHIQVRYSEEFVIKISNKACTLGVSLCSIDHVYCSHLPNTALDHPSQIKGNSVASNELVPSGC